MLDRFDCRMNDMLNVMIWWRSDWCEECFRLPTYMSFVNMLFSSAVFIVCLLILILRYMFKSAVMIWMMQSLEMCV